MATDDDPRKAIYQALGELVMRWNACEGRLRDMVIWLSGGWTLANYSLTAHMTAKALADTVPALTVARGKELREHFNHFATGVDTLREHRNYYAHGISAPANVLLSPEPAGMLTSVVGKQRVKIHFDIVGVDQLAPVIAQLREYDDYGRSILRYADPTYARGFLTERTWPTSWPDKPPRPDALKKRPPTLLGAPPQPESSEE